MLHLAAVLIPLFYLFFVVSITDSYRKNRLKIIIAAIAGLLFLIIAPTKLFINDVIPKSFFNFVPDAGPLYIYFTIYFFILVLYALYIIFRKYLESADLVEKNRFKYMILLPWLVFPEEEVFFFNSTYQFSLIQSSYFLYILSLAVMPCSDINYLMLKLLLLKFWFLYYGFLSLSAHYYLNLCLIDLSTAGCLFSLLPLAYFSSVPLSKKSARGGN